MRKVGFVVLSALLSTAASRAYAGGLEYSGAGSQALGRGGAVAAKADDPMVLYYNPAGLVELRGTQIMVDMNLAFMKACVDPIGYYGWGAYGGGSPSRLEGYDKRLDLNLGDGKPGPADQYYQDTLDTVCMKANTLAVPQFGITVRVGKRLGLGLGLMSPAAQPQGHYGDSRGLIEGKAGLRPAITRYMMINSGTIGIFPTVGAAYKLTDWLRIGAAFEWGMISVDNLSMAVVTAGTSPHNDILARVRAVDWFIPAVNASIHLVPFDALDIVAAFRYQDSLHAVGDIELTTNAFEPAGVPFTNVAQLSGVHQNFPWKFRVGVRYASRLAPRSKENGNADTDPGGGRLRDPFEDERWDIEADVEYQANSRNSSQRIDFVESQQLSFKRADGTMGMAVFPQSPRAGTPTDLILEKRWKDTISARVGGSYNIFPGLFGISWGVHYENRGVDPAYMQIDYWPLERLGLHAGIKIRIAHSIDLVASYAHIFQETITVAAPRQDTRENIYTRYLANGIVDGIDRTTGVAASRGDVVPVVNEAVPANVTAEGRLTQNVTQTSQGRPPWVVNSGTYRSGIDVVAVGMNVHF